MLKTIAILIVLSNVLVHIECRRRVHNSKKSIVAHEWTCQSGQTIPEYAKCDGTRDCLDGSDELTNTCISNACPLFSFRCAYGGCVSGKKKCDGFKDCWDESDETDWTCLSETQARAYENRLHGRCSEIEVQCGSGECIRDIDLCDGLPNCKDGSDETAENCAYNNCPRFAFRCAYGACISGKSRCNGLTDCADGSDELFALCDGFDNSTTPSHKPPLITTTTEGTPTATGEAKGCLVPDEPKALVFQNAVTLHQYKKGDYVSGNLTAVNFQCAGRKKLQGISESVCSDGQWYGEFPTCSKTVYCPNSKVASTVSTKTICSFNSTEIDCLEVLPVGTVGKVRCAEGYRMDDDFAPNEITVICKDGGHWNERIPKCRPICGEIPPGGENDTVPWLVSIFSKNNESGVYHFKCEGYIVRERIVITHAGCISSPGNPTLADDSMLYNIVEGEYKESYVNFKDTGRNVHNLTHLDLRSVKVGDSTPKYFGVLVLQDHFVYKPHVAPICLASNPMAVNVRFGEETPTVEKLDVQYEDGTEELPLKKVLHTIRRHQLFYKTLK